MVGPRTLSAGSTNGTYSCAISQSCTQTREKPMMHMGEVEKLERNHPLENGIKIDAEGIGRFERRFGTLLKKGWQS